MKKEQAIIKWKTLLVWGTKQELRDFLEYFRMNYNLISNEDVKLVLEIDNKIANY